MIKSLVDRFINEYDSGLQTIIEEYIGASAQLQTISSKSGIFADGTGLGEPKFNINLMEFTGDWGKFE